MSGLKIAALYGLKPHQLGLCGSREAARNQTLQKFLKKQASTQEAKQALEQFRGAYPYYKLIAKANRIKNPFTEKVVKAYWVGNELLDKVKTKDLRNMVARNFAGAGLLDKKTAQRKADKIPEGAKPHHSFHVLFIGSVTGSVNFNSTKIKDICRVGIGRIKSHKNGKIVVATRLLTGKKKIKLGKLVEREIFWDKDILPKLKIGDWISFHWNQAVEILTAKEAANLEQYTKFTLSLL